MAQTLSFAGNTSARMGFSSIVVSLGVGSSNDELNMWKTVPEIKKQIECKLSIKLYCGLKAKYVHIYEVIL